MSPVKLNFKRKKEGIIVYCYHIPVVPYPQWFTPSGTLSLELVTMYSFLIHNIVFMDCEYEGERVKGRNGGRMNYVPQCSSQNEFLAQNILGLERN